MRVLKKAQRWVLRYLENRVNEAKLKFSDIKNNLPEIELHPQVHQSNKVKDAVSYLMYSTH